MTTHESAQYAKAAWGSPTDAEFRAWGAACQGVLFAALTEVSSSTNWATATVPTTATTFNAGDVAVYRFADGFAGQGYDVFIKFEWGRGSATAGAANQFALRVTIGKDAAFTDATTSSYIGDGIVAAANDWGWRACFDDGCFVLTNTSLAYPTSTSPPLIVVERSRDYAGNLTEQDVGLWMSGPALNSTSNTSNNEVAQRQFKYSPFSRLATVKVDAVLPTISSLQGNQDTATAPVWGLLNGEASMMHSVVLVKTTTVGTYQNAWISRGSQDLLYQSSGAGGTGWFSQGDSGVRTMYRWG